MRLSCDICGGKLEEKDGVTLCSVCGMQYSEERVQEKMAELEPSEAEVKEDAAAKAAAKEEYRKFRKFWRYFICISIIAFMGVLLAANPLQEAIVFGFCLVATILDYIFYMPKKGKGGKKK